MRWAHHLGRFEGPAGPLRASQEHGLVPCSTTRTRRRTRPHRTRRDFRYQADAIVEETVNGTVARSYVVDDAGSTVKLVIPSGQPEAGTYLVTWNGHGDALALWRQETDGSLTLANSYTYDTWGRPTTATHNGIADLGFRYLYVGASDVQWDDAFGLCLLYMHARHYAPALGRFLQPDPDGSESNQYAYTANNPVTEVDPDGTCFILCAVVNAVIDTAIYLATTDSSEWSLGGVATAAATGAVTGFLGVGLLSKVTKVGALARVVGKAQRGLSRAGGRARSVAPRRSPASCALHSFSAATPVSLADGSSVPIASLEVGDHVLGWDEATGTVRDYPVSAVWVHDDPLTGWLVVDGEPIATTPGHRFFSLERGWVAAAELRPGEHVPSASGAPGTIESVRWDRGPGRMYDLTVALAHTFFVGAGDWLVHNCNGAIPPSGPYAHLADHASVGAGKATTARQRMKILDANMRRNGGVLRDDVDGNVLVRPGRHVKGVARPPNEAHIDHVIPRSRGGSNAFWNLLVRTRLANLRKGNR